jgi:hypothetical protein
LLAAALTGFAGAKPCSQATKLGGSSITTASAPTLAMKPAAISRSTGQSANMLCVATMPKTAANTSNTENSSTARATSPPVFVASATDAIPVISSDTTSGTTVMLSAFSQSPPNASTTPAASVNCGASARTNAPTMMPAINAASTIMLIDFKRRPWLTNAAL